MRHFSLLGPPNSLDFMDYRTLFFTYLASLTVYTAFAALLALRNVRARGLCWIAGSLAVVLVKYTLQGLEGHIPTVWSSLVANELYVVAFVMQLLGLRWFVKRSPLRHRWPLGIVGGLVALYVPLYVMRVPYIGNLLNISSTAIIAGTAVVLLRRGGGIFYLTSRWTAVFLLGQAAVYGYRAVLTNVAYDRPWLVVSAQHDPRWVYSLMAMMFFSTCVTLCSFWFFVVELQRELTLQSRTDALTGALNRRALYNEAERELVQANRTGHALCLLLMDIDDFKKLNDTYGHATGDLVLQRVVGRINSLLRGHDLLARTGGEEFAVLLPETNSRQAQIVAERLRHAIEALDLVVGDVPLHVSVSVGCAEVQPPCPALDSVLQRADAAMYTAKRGGKNRVIMIESTDLRTLASLEAASAPCTVA